MKHTLIRLAVLASFGAGAQAYATGLVTIPAAGFTNSAYTRCNTTGNFGSSIPTRPTATANNTCAVFPTSDSVAPEAGYTLVVSATRTIPSVTGGTTSIGNVVDRIWRKPAATAPATTTDMCIFGARATFTNADHNSATAGTQYFEMNGLARGGFSASGNVTAGYFIQATNASPVYRIGRTFTTVQYRALKYDTLANRALPGINYLALPTKNSVTAAINGENTPIAATTTATTTAAKQDAKVNSNWLEFTFDAGYKDDDGGTNPVTAMTYVKAPCNNATATVINSTWVKSGAIRLRQAGQENATFKEISISGYAPPGAVLP